MRTCLSTGLVLLLILGCSSPPPMLKLHSMPLVFVERRVNPIGFDLVLGLGEIHEGVGSVSIFSGGGTYYLDSVPAITGDVIPFEVDEDRYLLKVIAMGISRHQATSEYGLNIENFPMGRDCGVFEITPLPPSTK
jgi:hypothetical protein